MKCKVCGNDFPIVDEFVEHFNKEHSENSVIEGFLTEADQ